VSKRVGDRETGRNSSAIKTSLGIVGEAAGGAVNGQGKKAVGIHLRWKQAGELDHAGRKEGNETEGEFGN
jgi:hypothetical protein